MRTEATQPDTPQVCRFPRNRQFYFRKFFKNYITPAAFELTRMTVHVLQANLNPKSLKGVCVCVCESLM